MIEIVSIGAELLTGQTVNTNASTIARALLAEGYRVSRVTTVPDRHDDLKEGIEAAVKRASVVITTGGLGPTHDDVTRQTLAEIFEMELIHNEVVSRDLTKRFGDKLETIKDQATVLKGAEILQNPFGTAPGFILKKEGKTVVVLPGIPSQMQEMLTKYIIPYLVQNVQRQHFQHTLYLFLTSEQHVDPYLRELEQEYPEIEIGICPSYGTLALYLHTDAPSEKEAEKKFIPVLSALRSRFKECLFSETQSQIEYAIHKAFITKKKTLACAESCTGGRMASRLTQISGASDYFLGSLVTYSNHLKQAALQVQAETLNTHGAVSRETVLEMVQGTLTLSGADYAVAVSGIAGPTGELREKPVGTVWGAIGQQDGKLYAAKFLAKGKERRDIAIEYSVTYLLSYLWRFVELGLPPFEAL